MKRKKKGHGERKCKKEITRNKKRMGKTTTWKIKYALRKQRNREERNEARREIKCKKIRKN